MPTRRKPGIEVRQNTDGTKSYTIRWRQHGGRDGRNLSHSFGREKLAVDARNGILAAGSVCYCAKHVPDGQRASRAPGLLPDANAKPVGPTFGEYATRHAASLTGVGEGYRRDMLRDLARHLQSFAGRPLDGDGAITFLEVREWIRGMETGTHPWLLIKQKDGTEKPRPMSPTTVRRILAQAGAIMAAAMNDGATSRNPFRGHRLSRQATDEHAGMTFLTHAEWNLLERHLPDGVYRDLCGFLVGSGLRWGEASALTVGAVDLLASPPRVHVAQAWKKDGKGGVVLGPPKSARSRRTVPIAAWVRDLLIPHVAGKSDDELVFTTPTGRPLLHSNFYGKVWMPAVKKAQALVWAMPLEKRPRIHDLRHTYVSWSLAEGRPLSEVSRRVGHQSIHITDARYSHLMPDADAASAAALERYRTRSAD